MRKQIFRLLTVIFALCFMVVLEGKGFAGETSIIGTDDRVRISDITQEPYSGLVNIISEFSYGTTSGTGFFISDRVVATAAHCVYDADRKEHARSVSIYVPTNQNQWGGPYKIDQIRISPRYVAWTVDGIDLSGSLTEDYAALILNAPLDSEKHPFYWKSFYLSTANLTNSMDLKLTGVQLRNSSRVVYQTNGKLLRSNNSVMIYDLDSEQGLSGSPVYKMSNARRAYPLYEVLGIHNAVYKRNQENGGVRITSSVYNWYQQWINLRSNRTIPDGGYSIAPLSARDKVLIVPNSESSEHVYQYTYKRGADWNDYQYWTITYVGNGNYKITNNRSSKMLEVARGDATSLTPIIQFPYTGLNEQLWKISIVRTISDGWLKEYECVFTNVKTGKVLDMTNSSSGNYTEVIQFPYHGGNNQRFVLTRYWL